MTTIDRYIRELTERLPAAGGLRERVREEVTGHLSDIAHELESNGLLAADAEEQAVARFGSPDTIAGRFLEELSLIVQALGALLRPRLLLT
jgi:hypothetical protein